ncbi:MAG: hypothetical protein KGO96_13960, partial [Elusimicrobia bacterium]|nr:hypothetical protein [Elusimicrobiota bacterium]
MAIAVGAKASCNGPGVTTGAVTTAATGSSFAVVTGEYRAAGFSGVADITAPSDSKGNTYTKVSQVVSGSYRLTVWVATNGTGGSSHTWTN